MQKVYSQLQLPRRGVFYFAFAVGMIFAYALSLQQAAFPVLLAIGAFLAVVVWLAFRKPATGMEITAVEWRFFVGDTRWRVPLDDIASVSVIRWDGRPPAVALTFTSGRTDILPQGVVSDPDRLAEELARRGIRVVA